MGRESKREDARERNNQEGRGGNYNTEYSIFLENIPYNSNYIHIEQVFCRFGRITDIYIPRKVTKSKKRFGFVRFQRRGDAVRAVNLNERFLSNHKLYVAWARFQKMKNRFKKPYPQQHNRQGQKYSGGGPTEQPVYKQRKEWKRKSLAIWSEAAGMEELIGIEAAMESTTGTIQLAQPYEILPKPCKRVFEMGYTE